MTRDHLCKLNPVINPTLTLLYYYYYTFCKFKIIIIIELHNYYITMINAEYRRSGISLLQYFRKCPGLRKFNAQIFFNNELLDHFLTVSIFHTCSQVQPWLY